MCLFSSVSDPDADSGLLNTFSAKTNHDHTFNIITSSSDDPELILITKMLSGPTDKNFQAKP
jgi:hypothetical protein